MGVSTRASSGTTLNPIDGARNSEVTLYSASSAPSTRSPFDPKGASGVRGVTIIPSAATPFGSASSAASGDTPSERVASRIPSADQGKSAASLASIVVTVLPAPPTSGPLVLERDVTRG